MLASDGVLLATVAAASGAPDILTIETLDPASVSNEFTEHEVVAAYELGPSGSKFSPPVRVELDLARVPGIGRDGEMPLLWRSEGTGFELVGGQAIVDRDGAFVLRGEVPHFSTVVLTRGREMRLSFTSDDFAIVGQPVASSGQLSATANSQAHALVVVMEAYSHYAITNVRQSRDFGALNGGVQTVDRAYDPVTCDYGGFAAFDLTAEFTGFTTMRNGQRTRPSTVRREKEKRAFCHVPTGSISIGGPGTTIGGVV